MFYNFKKIYYTGKNSILITKNIVPFNLERSSQYRIDVFVQRALRKYT